MQSNKDRQICIGMILEDISTDFSKELVKSVVNALPKDRNIRLAVLPGKYDNGSDVLHHKYRAVHNSVFLLGEVCRLDGAIIHLGSVGLTTKDRRFGRIAEGMQSLPKVFIGLDDPSLITVNYDNESGIAEAVNYLVNICGITEICMLGGRAENRDACKRKEIFVRCIEENGLKFRECNFIHTDMTEDCTDAAAELLDLNPAVKAIFCVNDAAAKGLYKVMEERELVPGRDIMVFGFDNTYMSSELTPPLASVGADGSSLGQRALELVLRMIDGDEVSSSLIKTRLFGRASLPYEMYDYTTMEMLNVDTAFIYRMFDDCFYRYRNSSRDRETIDLKRLFFEFISRMLISMKHRYMGVETFDEIGRLIDIFFDNGAMKYTDPSKLIHSIDRLQTGMLRVQLSPAASIKINRLFLRMKDNALLSVSAELSAVTMIKQHELQQFEEFAALSMGYDDRPEKGFERILSCIGRLGSDNAAFYLFEEPVECISGETCRLPQNIDLKCTVRDGAVRMIPEPRQRCSLEGIFSRIDIPRKCRSFLVFPVFHRETIYGLLLCAANGDIYDEGEYIALQLGRAVYLNREQPDR